MMAKSKLGLGMEVTAIDSNGSPWGILTIVRGRVNNKGWITSDGCYWSKSGKSVGSTTIVPTTDEHRAVIRLAKLRSRLSNFAWKDVAAEKVEQIAALLGIEA